MSKSPFLITAAMLALVPAAGVAAHLLSASLPGAVAPAVSALPAEASTASIAVNATAVPDGLTEMVAEAREKAQNGLPNLLDAIAPEATFASTAEVAPFTTDAGIWTPARIAVPASAKAPARARELKPGYYISKDRPASSSSVIESVPMQYIERNDSLILVNVAGLPSQITVSNEDGIFSIPAQKIYSFTQGDAYICPINTANNTYDPEGSVRMSVNNNGEATVTAWGVFIIDGPNKNLCYRAYNSSNWIPSNASSRITDVAGEVYAYPMLIEQPRDNRIYLYNIVGRGGFLEATITPSKQIRITPQFIMSNSMYGDAYCYRADWTKKTIDSNNPITGRPAADGSLLLDDWSVSWRANPSQSILQADDTKITTTAVINWPQALTVSFDGQGTGSSPYLIKSVADMMALSQAVADGETYASKVFALASDINMASSSRAWDPIGDSSAPFAGKFSGNGHKITGFTANGRGASRYALFGHLAPQATLDGISLESCSVAGTGECVAALAAWNEGSIRNCSVSGDIAGAGYYTAAVAAVNAGSISGCEVAGSVSGYGNIGSIAGHSYGTVKSSNSSAAVRAAGYMSSTNRCLGGIVGMLSPLKDTDARVSDCVFSGSLSDAVGYAYSGGIVGGMVLGHVERCINVGLVTGTRSQYSENDNPTGGLVGSINESTLKNCINAGTVLKQQTSEFVGGIVGYLSCAYGLDGITDMSEIENCLNVGYIGSSSAQAHKGVFGSAFELHGVKPDRLMIRNCFYDAQVNPLQDELYGRPTSFFTSGSVPEGFSSDTWFAVQGRYPLPESVADVPAASVAAAVMHLSDGETAAKVKKAFSLSADNSVRWSLLSGNSQTNSTQSLTISGSQVTIGNEYGNETLVAANADGSCMKAFYLSVVPKAFDGDGTQAAPYLIKSKADFITLNKAVATYGQAHAGDFFRLENDVDFNKATDFNGIGVGTSNAFGGYFDGNGKTLRGLRVHTVAYEADGKATPRGSFNYGALFAVLSSTATVRDLTIAADADFDFWGYSGALAGHNAGHIIGCRNYAPVKGIYQYIGGLAGYNAAGASIEDCYNAGEVKSSYGYVGGIVGQSMGSVARSQNDGYIHATQFNDYVQQKVKDVAGGIAGQNMGSIVACVNNATVSSDRGVGGIAGYNSAALGQGSIKQCVSNGNVDCRGDYDTRGAIIGNALSRGDISDNWYDSSVNPIGAATNLGIRGVTGASTSKLVSGDALTGLDAELFDFAKGKYPVLKKFAAESAGAALRSMYPAFGEGEIRTNVVKDVELSAPQGIAWTLRDGSANFSIAGSKLSVTQPTDLTVASDTLTATLGSFSKVYPLRSIPNVLEGQGSEASPFLIRSVADINKLADFIVSASMDYNGFFFRLENDIDYAGAELKPLGSAKVKFQADFNGNNHTIKGFNYENTGVNDGQGRYVGFFVTLGEAARVHHLTLNGTVTANGNVGGFAGRLYGKIENCVNLSNVTAAGSAGAGGFVANSYQDAEITDCVNRGNVSTGRYNNAAGIVSYALETNVSRCSNEGQISGNISIGGIAARISGSITDCVNSGRLTSTVTGTSEVDMAGIAAYGLKGTSSMLTISNCRNTADISGPRGVAGILASTDGYDSNTKSSGCYVVMTGCYNTGNISANSYASGVAGDFKSGCDISDCYNTGNVTTVSGHAAGCFNSLDDDPNNEVNRVARCYNTGTVKAGGTTNGGFAAQINNDMEIDNCYNLGDVSTTYTGGNTNQAFTAGFCAYLNGHITNCFNAGNVTSTQFGVGGFSTYGSPVVERCVNLGNVTCTDTKTPSYNFGAVAAFATQGQTTLIDCANFGTITGYNRVAGLHARMWNGATITNCYNAGDIVVTGPTLDGCDLMGIPIDILDGPRYIVGSFYSTEAKVPEGISNSFGVPGCNERSLALTDLGQAWSYDRGALPLPAGFVDTERLHFAASRFFLADENDTPQAVTSYVFLPRFADLEWTSEQNVVFNDHAAYPTALGQYRITCKAPVAGLTKHFDFTVTRYTGIDGIDDGGRQLVERRWYDMQGRALAEPVRGQVMIMVSRYADGTSETRRVIID